MNLILLLALSLIDQPQPDAASLRLWEPRLAADSFRTREQAMRRLTQRGRLGCAIARGLLADSLDPEVRLRARSILDARKAKELRSLGVMPYIDSNYYSTATHTYHFSHTSKRLWPYLENRADLFGPGWPAYRAASREWASDMLDAGVPAWAMRLWFVELRRRDRDFDRHCGWPAVPLAMPKADE